MRYKRKFRSVYTANNYEIAHINNLRLFTDKGKESCLAAITDLLTEHNEDVELGIKNTEIVVYDTVRPCPFSGGDQRDKWVSYAETEVSAVEAECIVYDKIGTPR